MSLYNKPIRVKALIVGGGPIGLIAAFSLGHAGVRTALIAPETSMTDQRTTALLGASVDFLDELGIWSSLQRHAAPLRTIRLIDDTHRLLHAPETVFHAHEIQREAFGYNLTNQNIVEELTALLLKQAEVITLVRSRFAKLDDAPDDRIALVTESGDRIEAELAIAADGRHSPLRQAAGINTRTTAYPQTALVVNVRHTFPHEDISTEFHTATGPFTLVPLGDCLSSIVCVVTPEEAEHLSTLSLQDLGGVLELRAHSILGRMEVMSPPQVWPLTHLKAERLGKGRILLIGETAHVLPPIGAQGMNLGIRDVAALTQIVSRAHRARKDLGGAEIGEAYQHARWPDITSRSLGVDLLNRSLLSAFLPTQIARLVFLGLMRAAPSLRRILMNEGLGISSLLPNRA